MNPWSFDATDAELLSDPERAIGFGAPGASLEIFYRWFSIWLPWS